MNKTLLAACAASLLLSGCSIFAPYDSKFQCERSRDYGKCTDVAGAYSDALGGDMDGHSVEEPEHGNKKSKDKGEAEAPVRSREDDQLAQRSFNRYKTAEYGEMANLIEKPVTPVVAPPKVLRSLVVAYATPEKTLYLPRYVYFFVSEGTFVMGDYLNVEKPGAGGVMYPNGQIEGLR